jgi:two-component system CheB/CheR fusion protein
MQKFAMDKNNASGINDLPATETSSEKKDSALSDIPGNAEVPEVPEASEVPEIAETPDLLEADPAPTNFPIAGIGASAGGLAAFESFFAGMPVNTDPGVAFVLVQHLAPDHKSILSDLISRYTRLPVFDVVDGMIVKINCIYIIPPNRDMAILNGALQLFEPSAPRGQRLPIDFFFRSLALDQHERAIGIILSGTGSDGTQGIRAIKGEGGLVIVQDPTSTEFDGMPLSAIASGMADFKLPLAQMLPQLINYVTHSPDKLPLPASMSAPKTVSAIKKIFILLRAQTSHDFSNYKPSTIHRRIERRMAVHQLENIESYVRFLQQTPTEVEALFRDLLIGVTSFFRDHEAFRMLEERVIPKLFEGKPAGAVIRIWSTGCSTGEEAYSLAILIQEYLETSRQNYSVQVFATDIDSRAIAIARHGLYSNSIASDISPERLGRFFTIEMEDNAYRIHKSIRDMLIFSEHDMIKDPPFSRLDLISCRNLLIYLNATLQKKIIPLFHYALNPGGILFLGTSEGIGEFDDLFGVIDRKAKLYERKISVQGGQRSALGHFLQPGPTLDLQALRAVAKPAAPARQSLREVTEQAILSQLAPASALVNAHGDILYLYGRTGRFLELAPGETGVNNILRMAREGLRPTLSSALHRAAFNREIVHVLNVHVKTNGHYTAVNLTIRPVTPGAETNHDAPLYLVIFEDQSDVYPQPELQKERSGATGSVKLAGDKTPAAINAEAHIEALERKLQDRDAYLQAAQEELESSNEELKSANEEMQSVNEELQSTNEEMETSKEELQSVNEELATVNMELQTKVHDLSRANNDMNNLLAGTGIGTVFVDHQLRILRFTPAVSQIINLIAGDLGRPVAHVVSNLVGYSSLVADTQAVLSTLIPKEIDVQTTEGNWYTMRIQPYRTLNNVIEGAVITFADITALKLSEAALRKSANELLRLAVVVRDAHDAITVQDLNGRILAWNPGAERLYGWTEAEALQMNVRDRIPEQLRDQAKVTLDHLNTKGILQSYHAQRINKRAEVIEVTIISTALMNEAGQIYAIATTERALAGDSDAG